MKITVKPLVLGIGMTSFLCFGCQEDGDNVTPSTNTSTPVPVTTNFSGNLSSLFVGHSAMNFIVDDYVKLMAEEADSQTSIDIETVTASGGLSLVSKMELPEIAPLFTDNAAENYDFVVLTEQWDYQFYNPTEGDLDTNTPVNGCPPSNYTPPSSWVNPPDDWFPTPYPLQQYTDAIRCAGSQVFYYQTWSLGYNEVNDGALRLSDQNYVRPTIEEIRTLQANGEGMPDLPLADRVEFEGVKWESFVKAANRPDIVFIPAGYAFARLIREIEVGNVPGFEAIRNTNGMNARGELVWTDYLFYQDQYHASTVSHYFVSLVIYASIFNQSPEGLEVGSDRYLVSEAFFENQYPLEGISNARYEELLEESGANGIYDLRGYDDKDYMHDDLRLYLQRLAWTVVQEDSAY